MEYLGEVLGEFSGSEGAGCEKKEMRREIEMRKKKKSHHNMLSNPRKTV